MLFHLSEQNFEPKNQRGSDKRGCTFLLEQLRVLEIFSEVHCTHMYCQTQAYHYQVASG